MKELGTSKSKAASVVLGADGEGRVERTVNLRFPAVSTSGIEVRESESAPSSHSSRDGVGIRILRPNSLRLRVKVTA